MRRAPSPAVQGVVVEPAQVIARVLQSLEYENSRKVEGDIVQRLHERFGVPQEPKVEQAARAFANVTTVEDFLGAVLRLLGPYVAMLRDIYRLLAAAHATEAGSAEKLRLDDHRMRRACRDLPLSEAFLQRLHDTYRTWRERKFLNVNWEKLAQLILWDGKFHGRLRGYPLQILMFAPMIVGRLRVSPATAGEVASLEQSISLLVLLVEAIIESAENPLVGPDDAQLLLDAAYIADAQRAPKEYVTTIDDDLPGLQIPTKVTLSLQQARSGVFSAPTSSKETGGPKDGSCAGFLVLLTILHGRIERAWPARGSRIKDLQEALELALAKPGELRDRIDELREELQLIAPAVDRLQEEALIDRVLEVIDLPFWKERPRLYEVWVLVRTAQAIGTVSSLRVLPRLEREGDIAVLRLPKNAAKAPVFDVEVADEGQRSAALVWFQRRTREMRRRSHHYEPDVRCTRLPPRDHDLFIVECKDRIAYAARHQGEGFEEVAHRYLGASDADLVWLVNYSRFGEEARPIEEGDGRVARFAAEFFPGNTPPEFDDTIRKLLTWQLAPLLPPESASPVPAQPAPVGSLVSPPAAPLGGARIELRWQATPTDLDLYLWREDWPQQISYVNHGALDNEPWAALAGDVQRGFGPEEITIVRFAPVRYVVAVSNYSGDAPLAGCGAEITVHWGSHPITVKVPETGHGAWWHVLEIDGTRGSITVANRVCLAAPWSKQ